MSEHPPHTENAAAGPLFSTLRLRTETLLAVKDQGDSAERKTTFAYRERDFRGSSLIEKDIFGDYADLDGGWILTYNGSKLVKIGEKGISQYAFLKEIKPIDALVAAYKLSGY